MNAFLWTVAIVAGLNTLSIVVYLICRGSLPEVTPPIRFLDALATACFGVWALCLLFR